MPFLEVVIKTFRQEVTLENCFGHQVRSFYLKFSYRFFYFLFKNFLLVNWRPFYVIYCAKQFQSASIYSQANGFIEVRIYKRKGCEKWIRQDFNERFLKVYNSLIYFYILDFKILIYFLLKGQT